MPTAKVSSPSTDHQAEQDINQSETVFKKNEKLSPNYNIKVKSTEGTEHVKVVHHRHEKPADVLGTSNTQ